MIALQQFNPSKEEFIIKPGVSLRPDASDIGERFIAGADVRHS